MTGTAQGKTAIVARGGPYANNRMVFGYALSSLFVLRTAS
ncbi:Uncharacterised protein [Bordetella pertussis]|nr:Uncharacterised protein [Bordetella pertussis]